MSKLFFFLLWFFSIIPAIAGHDQIITCTSSGCTKSDDLPLFSESNIYPSYLISQKVTVINNRSGSCDLKFKLINNKIDDILSSALTVSVTQDPTVWYSGHLSDLFDDQLHSLGAISSGNSTEFLWTVSFDQASGNEFQNQANLFGMDFNFICDDEITPAPVSNPSSSSPSTTSTVCTDTVPTIIPTNFSALAGINTVTLSWTEPSGDFTYYLIAFGEDPAAVTYGNPNIGGRGTTSYTVGSLSAGQTYYFKIRVGNGCAPGQFSTIISATPGGQVIENPIIPQGFQENVLGVEETLPSSITESPTNPSILGETTGTCQKRFFPWILIGILLFNLIFARKKLLTFLFTLILLVTDYLILKNNCPYLWAYDLGTFIVPRLLAILFL